MADVMITCPTSGRLVPTGIGMDFETFKHVAMADNVLVDCIECGEDHVWQGAEAVPDS